MALTWYENQTIAEACRFGSLAWIIPLIERMNVAGIIDNHVPADPQAEFPHGTVLSLLMAARLHNPVALMNVGEWAVDSGADILWDMSAEKINDDRLGRSLDAFFPHRHSILAHLALHVSQEFDVPLTNVHYDPTHIVFQGAYEESLPREGVVGTEETRSDHTLEPAHITKGRASTDVPKGAKMVHAGLCTHVDEWGPLPFFGHTVDGNQNGRTAVAEQLALLYKHVKPPKLTMYSDRGTFSAGHLARLRAAGHDAVCAALWGEFQPLFDEHRKSLTFKQASYLSIEQQRRRKQKSELPQEHYELAVLRHEITDNASHQVIPCRVMFVFSTADQKVVRVQRQKQIDRLTVGLEKLKKSVAEGRRNTTPEDVARRVARVLGKTEAARYFSWEMIPLSKAEQAQLPKPKPGCKRPIHKFHFQLQRRLIREDEQYDGYSAMVTTVPQNRGSADSLFTQFKQQIYSEQANSQFKGPLAVRPVYLHSPKRVEALVFLMMISLTAYYLLQRLYRQTVSPKAPPKEQRITASTLKKAFNSYTLLIHHTRLGRKVQTTRLTTRQRTILQRLGFPTPAQILSRRLPRAPT